MDESTTESRLKKSSFSPVFIGGKLLFMLPNSLELHFYGYCEKIIKK